MANIVLVNPRFELSYWGLEHALPLLRKRASMPVAGLALLAALTPSEHSVTIVDENIEPLDFDRLARADIVGVTGMNVQRSRMRQILAELKKRGAFIVVGGPWITVKEDYFSDMDPVIFVGEAEETWPRFLQEWEKGSWDRRYEQTDNTDMSRVPVPRYDLLKMHHYLFGSVQFSRGCPFQCEFCDIIVTFGRRPRLKNFAQVREELSALRARRMRIVFIVDDNLIGNKKAIKPLLRDLVSWQKENGFPFLFVTEASLDLAEDEEMMRLMLEANILSVFVGIESPNEESLKETKKYQNLHKGSDLIGRVSRIQNAGLEVWCGMILGFDHDDRTIFDWQRRFIHDSHIVHAMVGMLSAIPKTPLYDRLASEGRLDYEDEPEFGTNVIPVRMSREELRDGYVQIMKDIYHPDAYFERLDGFIVRQKFRFAPSHAEYLRHHPAARIKVNLLSVLQSGFLFWQLMRKVPDQGLRAEYRRRARRVLLSERDPAMLFGYLLKCAMHYHHHTIAKQMAERMTAVVNPY
jgi:radical SAM superfamily enzyme YgiQ (UPF0313 family)